MFLAFFFFFFQAEDGIRDHCVTGVQTCALPIWPRTARAEVACDELLPEPLPRASGGRNGNLAERGPPAAFRGRVRMAQLRAAEARGTPWTPRRGAVLDVHVRQLA